MHNKCYITNHPRATYDFCLVMINTQGLIANKLLRLTFKVLMPITSSSPRVQQEVVLFWCQMKAHLFLIITPNFQLQIHCTSSYVQSSLIPSVTYLFMPLERRWKILLVKLCKMCVSGYGQSV